MRFQFTLNMPSRNGNAVHQVIGDHCAPSLSALLQAISTADFIVIEEHYRDGTTSRSVGDIAINPLFIGKIKAIEA